MSIRLVDLSLMSNWDEPLQGKLAKEAGAVLEEMVLMEDVFYHCSVQPAGGKGRPELCGWWCGGKTASVTCLYSRYKLDRTKDVKDAAPGDKDVSAKDGVPAEEAAPAAEEAATATEGIAPEEAT